ncbi:MAG: Hsp20/alpha crystallin family protein [Persicimonas sp.]
MFGSNRNDWMRPWLRNEFRNELQNFFQTNSFGPQTGTTRRTSGVFPAINMYDDGESFLVRAELPGVDSESLDISAKGDQLVIRGERSTETPAAEADLHRREREGGQFRRAVSLPQEIDPEGVEARLEHGILEVYAPRSARQKPRKVQIKS